MAVNQQNPGNHKIFNNLKSLTESFRHHSLAWLIGASILIFFTCSSVRHILFQSLAFDLGIFDQAVYLISQGKEPFSTFLGFHILGDHAALIWYPLALLYKIYPSVYWLFAVQSVALAAGALPVWHLAKLAGLDKYATTISAVYLLYPVIFNVNLFDFHSEVIAMPMLFTAVWCARTHKWGYFCLSVVVVLMCKAVLAFTVVGMGVWLLLFERRRWYGATAIIMGVFWFVIASKVIIPTFNSQELTAVARYSYLGSSIWEIAKNLIISPSLVLSKIFTLDNLVYLILLSAPIFWGLSLKGAAPLVGAIPCVALNLIADYQPQKDLVHQYSVPAVPFLILAVIATLAAGKGLVRSQRGIIIWSLIGFLLLAKFTYFGSIYLKKLDTWQATNEAVQRVKTQGSVLTTASISPHLSHRQVINLAFSGQTVKDALKFDYILMDVRYPGWNNDSQSARRLVEELKRSDFKLIYQRTDVYLFQKVVET
ncbi:hypothetical protein NIES4071_80480 [Calothrix sp. NIES-4071]|nr:hypothetical protein NIES4071_80480 [Calothrix sp. NIES-4071]BAZ62318.1 hypothetical protein NIES4105_80410 [Calothrix sp. NIES-4105]